MGGASCQSGGACFNPPPHPLGGGEGLRRCPPASARERRDQLPAGVLARQCRAHIDFRREDREVESATLSTCIAGDCASDLLRFLSWGSESGDSVLVNLHRWRLCERLTVIFVVGIGRWGRRPCQAASLEIVQATYGEFRRGDREVETATLSTCIAGDCASDLL